MVCVVLYTKVITNHEREIMTYTTASFETGSEFRVSWVIFTDKPNSKYGTTIGHRNSDIFDTYEAAEAFNNQLSYGAEVMVRLPGNKNFRTTRDTKKLA